MKHRLFLIAAAVVSLSITGCGEDSASSNQADTVKTSERDTSASAQSAVRPDINDPEQRAGQNETVSSRLLAPCLRKVEWGAE